MALLAAYLDHNTLALENFLREYVFEEADASTLAPDAEDVAGFEKFLEAYKKGLAVERKAVECMRVQQ